MDQKPSLGRIVHMKLSAGQAENINLRRHQGGSARSEDASHLYYGNSYREGDLVAMLVTRVWSEEGCINGQALLDGNDSEWFTSVLPGDGLGQWSWPPRV